MEFNELFMNCVNLVAMYDRKLIEGLKVDSFTNDFNGATVTLSTPEDSTKTFVVSYDEEDNSMTLTVFQRVDQQIVVYL